MTSLRERRVWAIVPAAGRGARFASSSATRSQPKQYAALRGATVIEWSLRALLAEPRIHAVVVALAPDDSHWVSVASRLKSNKLYTTLGGPTRQQTVLEGLAFLAAHADPHDWVLVHDAARPCLSLQDLGRLLDALETQEHGAVLAAPLVDTIKRETREGVATVDREGLWRALTPQVFALDELRTALEDSAREGVIVTDEAQAIERRGGRPALVAGSAFNVKVTRPEDLIAAENILKNMEETPMRVGQGFDVHAFGEGDHVVLGGVRIPHVRGIVAHSDGDVVIHALCDAVLGALGDGDIGQHFPDTDARYRGADSRTFLKAVAEKIAAAGLKLMNADVTVVAEAPRIGAHRAAMARNLAEDLGVSIRQINIKATTTERLGFIGRGDGLAAFASVLLGV
ncbi:MAG TPA: 2-C-methyl-D-erythritol 4-phosphate cytidylyltransferase [Steroidobacteraceae bacterium]|nr:2-C-methyl-D-erythritol 4-phosphate cytidylyltransferase [Steroidobacteraceae bacterium]